MGTLAGGRVRGFSDCYFCKCPSNAFLVRRPDEFVRLQLETDGQGVGDDPFHQLPSRDRDLARRNGPQRFVLLVRQERRNPGE
jgi:hypothetical protein